MDTLLIEQIKVTKDRPLNEGSQLQAESRQLISEILLKGSPHFHRWPFDPQSWAPESLG